MPTGTWFQALTPEGYTAWSDPLIEAVLSSSVSELQVDLKDNVAVYNLVVRFNDVGRQGVPISLSAPGVVSVDGTQSGTLGVVRVTPLAVGMTVLNIGPYLTADPVSVQIEVIDTSISPTALRLSPSSLNMDLTTGGIWVTALYGVTPVANVDVAIIVGSAFVQAVDRHTDEHGRFRLEPLAVGDATVRVGTDTFSFSVSRSVADDAYPRTLRLNGELPVMRVGDPPIKHGVRSHNLVALNLKVSCETTGFTKTSRDSQSGDFYFLPRSAGEDRVVFTAFDPVKRRKLEVHRRFEVLP